MTRTTFLLIMAIIVLLLASGGPTHAQTDDCAGVLNQAGITLSQAANAARDGDAATASQLAEEVRTATRPCVPQNVCPALANFDSLLTQSAEAQDANQALEFINTTRLLIWACGGTGNTQAVVPTAVPPTPIPLPTPTATDADTMARPACTAATMALTNVRAQPSVIGAVVGQVQVNVDLPVIAQFQDREEELWWLLQAGGWVQDETVSMMGDCDDLPPPPIAAPINRQQSPANGVLMTGGIGRTDSAPMSPGEFQVEWYCTDRGLNVSTDRVDWYCVNEDGNVVERLSAEAFDYICQQTYNTPYTYAIQERTSGRPLAFSWRCYAAN